MIRKYDTADLPKVLDLLRHNTPAYFAPEEGADFNDYLQLHGSTYYVALEGEEIVGSGGINFGFNGGKKARISWDMVHPDWQGKGLGSALLNRRIVEIKKDRRVETIEVRTSQLAYEFYGKLGFKLIETAKDFWAPEFDLYRMEMGLR